MRFSGKIVIVVLLYIVCTLNLAWGGFKFDIDEQTKGEIGIWTQAWYQYVEDGKDSNNDGVMEEGIDDFMLRRVYFYLKGQVTPYFSLFTHIAGDRLGQDGLDDSSLGLGSGIAFRDLWATLNLHEAFKIQAGRMYVPLTRNYGTTSTKTLLTTELDWAQGGIRSNIFYPSKVGRDDGATFWGNIRDGLVQYRFMVAEGVESSIMNPNDNLRFAGRISINLFEPETGWFNQGTYLGEKRVLAIGVGGDYQEDLMFGTLREDYSVRTADLFYDQPFRNGGALTFEASYIDISNGPNSITFTPFSPGDDGSITSLKAGYLIPARIGPGQFQPSAHYQNIDVDEAGKNDTEVYGVSLNYYIKGHANKISMDFTFVDQDEEFITQGIQDHFILTFQIAIGF